MQAAVQLFAENGFSSASVRAIAETAGVNVAALNYHYGSKAKLFEAAFEHCAAPINTQRIRQLDALEALPGTPTVEMIVRAFVDVGLTDQGDAAWSQLIARIFVEPKTKSKPLLEQVFGPIVKRFVAALERTLPEVDVAELEWRFHFVIGSMLQLIRSDRPLRYAGSQSSKLPAQRQIDELVKFVAAGLCQENSNQ
ncbi:MAG: AcrR family transcriptional regulator [Limisphaerales bacterium]|jgi:AcrR family transcriptional regulator